MEPRIESDLREFDLGEWEGVTYRELMQKKRFWHHMLEDPAYAPHGGESPAGVSERLAGALRRIADRHVEQRIVVVTHGGALSLAFGLILDNDYSQWQRVMDNCAVSELVFEPAPELDGMCSVIPTHSKPRSW